MRQYKTSLAKRRRRCERSFTRYWNEPDYRLARINADRARRGRPLIGSLDEVAQGWSRVRV